MDTVHYSSKDQGWRTPREIFDPLNAEFNFTMDAAASAENSLLDRYCSAEDDALTQSWEGERVWCNPPYGRALTGFVAKMAAGEADIVVGFIPARTDTRWFHAHVLGKAEVRYLKGRVKFVGAKHNAPFPSMICIWRRHAAG